MVQTDRQTPLSPLDYHYNVVEFSRFTSVPLFPVNPPHRAAMPTTWLGILLLVACASAQQPLRGVRPGPGAAGFAPGSRRIDPVPAQVRCASYRRSLSHRLTVSHTQHPPTQAALRAIPNNPLLAGAAATPPPYAEPAVAAEEGADWYKL